MAKGSKSTPNKYRPEYAEQVRTLCRLGATGEDLAECFGVSDTTIDNWLSSKAEFRAAVEEGREVADSTVERRLFERATGYSHPEEKIFCHNGKVIRAETTKHYPPDTSAAIFWLKNRKPDDWRDRVEHTGKDGAPLEVLIRDPRSPGREGAAQSRDPGS